MQLDRRTKTSIRRHLGVMASGYQTLQLTFGMNAVISSVAQLELYMNALQAPDYCAITGNPSASIFVQYGLTVGQTITVTYTPLPSGATTTVSYTVTPADMATGAPQQVVTQSLAIALNATLLGVISESSSMVQPLIPVNQLPPVAELVIVGTNTIPFHVTATGGTAQVYYDGTTLPAPSYVVSQGPPAVVAYGLLPICDSLESGMMQSSQYMGYNQAGSTGSGQVIFRKEELLQRKYLLDYYRHQMGTLLSFYPGDYPNWGPGNPSGTTIYNV